MSLQTAGKVDAQRLLRLFIGICKKDSAPLAERPVFDLVQAELKALGFDVREDEAGKRLGGQVGNLFAYKPGRGRLKDAPSILLSAHMDRVAGGIGVKPQVVDGVVRSEGDTILGADDAAGLAAILEAYRTITESGEDHPPLETLITIGEEIGLLGAKEADLSRLKSPFGYVLDADGPVGAVIHRAPTQYTLEVTLFGRSAHAGIAPEKGISAIKMAALAISRMSLGRVDFETTANVGYIGGGGPTNIVPERAEIRAETRSLDPRKVEKQLEHMKQALTDAAESQGGSVSFKVNKEYQGFSLSPQSATIQRARAAIDALGLPFKLEATGGGSDANAFNEKGLPCAVLGVGYQRIHTFQEAMPVDELTRLAELAVSLIMGDGQAM